MEDVIMKESIMGDVIMEENIMGDVVMEEDPIGDVVMENAVMDEEIRDEDLTQDVVMEEDVMDEDTIAYIYPLSDAPSTASTVIKLNPRYRASSLPEEHEPGRSQREATEPLGSSKLPADALQRLSNLVVRLRDIPLTNKGLVFGRRDDCDIILDNQKVSREHFSLTFDGCYRPIIKDLNSSQGTQVTYNGWGKSVRRKFQWIVGGADILRKLENIVVTIPRVLSFRIVVQPHNIKSSAYKDKVEKFNQGTTTPHVPLDSEDPSHLLTRLRSEAHTPEKGPIYLKRKLREGSFGMVTYRWNVSSGEERVVKTPVLQAIRAGQVNHHAWEREARIMTQISHRHIVKLIEWVPSPQPELHLEYMPHSSLDSHENISHDETLTIVYQCSSALAYLHERQPPIAHRDIKPANILVEHRSETRISVKLGDFGLAKSSDDLKTQCGTWYYAAPEAHSDGSNATYTVAVDIWSLGVVAGQLLYSLPRNTPIHNRNGLEWCRRVAREMRKSAAQKPTALGSLLIDHMLVMAPDSRYTARACYAALEDLQSTTEGPVIEDEGYE